MCARACFFCCCFCQWQYVIIAEFATSNVKEIDAKKNTTTKCVIQISEFGFRISRILPNKIKIKCHHTCFNITWNRFFMEIHRMLDILIFVVSIFGWFKNWFFFCQSNNSAHTSSKNPFEMWMIFGIAHLSVDDNLRRRNYELLNYSVTESIRLVCAAYTCEVYFLFG